MEKAYNSLVSSLKKVKQNQQLKVFLDKINEEKTKTLIVYGESIAILILFVSALYLQVKLNSLTKGKEV